MRTHSDIHDDELKPSCLAATLVETEMEDWTQSHLLGI